MPDQGTGQTPGPGAPSIDDAEAALGLGTIPASTLGPGGTGSGGGPVGVEPVELGNTRKTIAFFLLWILVGIIVVVVLVSLVFTIMCWLDGTKCAAATTSLNLLTTSVSPVFTAMVGLVGSVVGFYFGSRQT
ncbi:MAG TPA: hypothetical protein VFP12_15575 [Allosphingosinicella sp.]|nr:hypothetical protein [Allosphingosinicella sp.]